VLLHRIGYDKPLTCEQELKDTASSLCVASFEAIFGVRLADVRRFPNKVEDYEHNASCMFVALRRLLPSAVLPQGVDAQDICRGDIPAIETLIRTFLDVDDYLSSSQTVSCKFDLIGCDAIRAQCALLSRQLRV